MRALCLVVILAVFLGGCARVAKISGMSEPVAPTSGKGELLPGSEIRASGFLGNYSALNAAPTKGEWQYVKPGVDWKSYNKILILPMEVWLNPNAEHPAIEPTLYKEIETAVRDIVTRDFQAGGYQIVTQPGPGVLTFHYSITGVTPVRQGLQPSDILPAKAAITALRYATGTEAYYVALSGEIEVLDSQSKDRLFAAVGGRRSFATTLKREEITYAELKDAVTHFAQEWRVRLDRARGVGK